MSAITDELARAGYLAVVMVILFLGLRSGLPDTAVHRGAAIVFAFLAGTVLALPHAGRVAGVLSRSPAASP